MNLLIKGFPDDLHRELLIEKAERGMTLRELVVERCSLNHAAKEGLEKLAGAVERVQLPENLENLKELARIVPGKKPTKRDMEKVLSATTAEPETVDRCEHQGSPAPMCPHCGRVLSDWGSQLRCQSCSKNFSK